MKDLESKLIDSQSQRNRVIVTDGVFSMDGYIAKLDQICDLAEKYKEEGMAAYSKIQQHEFAREKDGYTSVKHQREVGTSYFDAVSNTISSGKSSTTAMDGSTESEQF